MHLYLQESSDQRKWGTLFTLDISEFVMCTGHQMYLTNSMEQNLS